ncbi:MAG: PAS domain S-box protein [Solirubrobacteraceae bacterium]|nr:PAS domain S-box protein [Solirubrobacteraceae bacterium]
MTDTAFDQLLEFMPDAALVVAADGGILMANNAAGRLFDHDPLALVGEPVEALIPQRFHAAHPAHRAHYQAAPRTRPMGAGLTLYGRRRNGSEFPAEVMLSAATLDAEPIVVVAVRDVSDRTGQQARARLAAVVESSADAILARDRDGIITDWNSAAQALYGYTADEMIGRSATVIVPPSRLDESTAVAARVLAGEAIAPYETKRVTKGGEEIDVSVSTAPIRDAEGRVVGASTTARDIRRDIRAASDRSYTDALVQNSADAIVGVDPDGVITAWNPAAERLLGYTADEAIGQVAGGLVDPPDSESQADVVSDVMAGATRFYEARRIRRDGQVVDLSVALAPMLGASGETLGAVSIVRDVTEMRTAENEANEARAREARLLDELNQTRRLESIGQLAGGVAHDFNNLLGVIMNYAQLVLPEIPEDSRAREDIDEIRRAAERGAALTRQLLIFSRREVVRPEVFDLNDLVRELENLLRRALGERIDLQTRLSQGLRHIQADRGQLEQVLVNLAVNGRDAMPNGGALRLQTTNVSLDEETSAQHADLEPGDYVLLKLTDSGVGMSPEVMERAFEPFFTTKPKGDGTGLGLATVYGIIKEAGGRVALYSELGFGTSVRVYLPATDDGVPRPAAEVPAPQRGAGEVILVTEDEPEVRRMTERLLVNAGYEVVSAAGGEEALEALREHDIDLLLSDVIMPGMVGPELVERARAVQPGLRVILMSGYSDQVLSHESLERQPRSGFLEKPFSAVDLETMVRQVLDEPAT